jgi:hypothetical protein
MRNGRDLPAPSVSGGDAEVLPKRTRLAHPPEADPARGQEEREMNRSQDTSEYHFHAEGWRAVALIAVGSALLVIPWTVGVIEIVKAIGG